MPKSITVHPLLATSQPEATNRIAAALGKPVTALLLTRPHKPEETIILDGGDTALVWRALNAGAKVLVHFTPGREAWQQELPHVKGMNWEPMSTDARSVWANVFRLSAARRAAVSWGDWTMPWINPRPGAFNWRPLCWLNLRDAHLWNDRLLDETLIVHKHARPYLKGHSTFDEAGNRTNFALDDKPYDRTQPQYYMKDGKIWQRQAPGVLHQDPKEKEGRMTFTLRTAVDRMPREASVQAYVNGWPLKLLPREYLRWLVYDGKVGDGEAWDGRAATSKTTYTRPKLPDGSPDMRQVKVAFELQMWTVKPANKDGSPNQLHNAIKQWLKESETGSDSLYPFVPGVDFTYNPNGVGAAYANADHLDSPEWREFFGSGYWSKRVVRPLLSGFNDDWEVITLEGKDVFRQKLEKATLGEWQNEFVSSGTSSKPDVWATQGGPTWLQVVPGRPMYVKGQTHRAARVREAIAEGDDDPTPWRLGLTENIGTGMFQVRDDWTSANTTEDPLLRDYVPPTPSDSPDTNFRRAWRIYQELERLNTPGARDEEGRRELCGWEWEAHLEAVQHEWPGPRCTPRYAEQPERPLGEQVGEMLYARTVNPDFAGGGYRRRGASPSVLHVLVRCETRAIKAIERRRLRDMRTQREKAARRLDRARLYTEAATQGEVALVLKRQTPLRCRHEDALREALVVAARQWSEVPTGTIVCANKKGSQYWKYGKAPKTPSRGARKFEEMFA